MTDIDKKAMALACMYTRACIEFYFNPSEENAGEELQEVEIEILEKYYRKLYEECKEVEEKKVVVTFAAISCFLQLLLEHGRTLTDLAEFYTEFRQKRHAKLDKTEYKDKGKVLLYCKILIADLIEEEENEKK